MKLKNIRAKAFGCFENFNSPDLTSNVIVFYGRNESGKSTIFNMITTILYGWSPASKNSNPYVPWEGSFAECEADIEISHRTYTINRRLRSRTEGTVIDGDRLIDVGNKSIFQLELLPREIFSQVYSLTVDEMCFPDQKLWQRMQDQLLGGQYGSFLRSITVAAGELENDANSLWRSDNRGKPQAKCIKEKISMLYDELKKAQQNQKDLYDIESKIGELNFQLEQKMERKAYIISQLKWYQVVYPVKMKFENMQKLMSEAGDGAPFEDIPADPNKELYDLEQYGSRLSDEYKTLAAKKQELEENIEQVSVEDKLIYENRENIKVLSKSYEQINMDRKNYEQLEKDLYKLKDNLSDRSSQIIEGGWKPEYVKTVKQIDEARLRSSIHAFSNYKSQLDRQYTVVTALKVKYGNNKNRHLIVWLCAGIFILGLVGSLLLGNSPLGFGSALMSVIGLGFALYSWFFKDSASSDQLKQQEDKLNDLNFLKGKVIEDIKKAVDGLPISSGRLEYPDETLLIDIIKLKNIVEEIEIIISKLDDISNRLIEKEKSVMNIITACQLAGKGDILNDILILENSLESVESKIKAADEAKILLKDINERIFYYENEIDKFNCNKLGIIEKLADFDGDSIGDKIRNLLYRRKCYNKAQNIKEELGNDYPNLEELIKDMQKYDRCDEQSPNDTTEAMLTIEREQLDSSLNNLNKEIGALKNDLEHKEIQETVDIIRGEMQNLDSEYKKITLKRDKLMLLRSILIEADKRFREEHQPDVLKKSGRYIDMITDGRYNKFLIMDDNQTELALSGQYYDFPVKISDNLSRGTREQIYLALRLAFMEHLDIQGETIPAFFDEVLINWDGIRRQKGTDIIGSISKERQVFIFTCHKWMVEDIVSKMDAQVIDINNIK